MFSLVKKILAWGFPIALAALAIGYSFYRRGDLAYWDGAVGNWLATLLGIVVGVPVALLLERNRAKSEQAARNRVEQQTRRDVLTLLHSELVDARQSITYRMTLGTPDPVEPLKTSTWDAMKATANLRHVSEPSLIGPLSEAYRLIHVLAQIETVLYRTEYGVNVQFPDGERASTKITRHAAAFYAPTIEAIDRVLTTVAAALEVTK